MENQEWNDRVKTLLDQRGWSVPKLAAEMGHEGDQSFVERLYKYFPKNEKRVSQPRGTVMAEMAAALGVTETFLRTGENPRPEPNRGPSVGDISFSRSRLPIHGGGGAAPNGKFLMGERIDERLRPPSLDAVPNAYGVFVWGDSMLERFRNGEVAQVHPTRPVRQGDDVVVQIRGPNDDEISGYIKRFVSRNAKELVLEQLNPPRGEDRIMRFPNAHVVAVHLIVGIDAS